MKLHGGRVANIYAIGGNPTGGAARRSSIQPPLPDRRLYVLSGVGGWAWPDCCSRRAPARASRFPARTGWSCRPSRPPYSVAARSPAASGTIVGGDAWACTILGVLNNGMILASVPTFYQMVARGVLLIAAVVIAEQQARRYA